MQTRIEIKRRGIFSIIVNELFVFILIMAFFAPQVMSTDYYVATNGTDNNNGSINSPWRSLKHAIDVAGAGDTIFMRGGTYTTNEVWIKDDMGGAPGQYMTIKNYPGETVSVGGSRWFDVEGPYVRIEGLHFRLPYSIDINSNGQVVNNTFIGSQAGYGVIFAGGDNLLIEGNHIEVTGGGDTQDHGIYLIHATNVVIRNNFISGASGYNIHIYDEDKGSGEKKRYENVLVENNFLTSSQERAGIVIGAHDQTVEMDGITIRNNVFANHPWEGILIKYEPISNVTIINNTFYGNNDGGINIFTGIDNLVIRNNIFANSGQSHIGISGSISNGTISHNLYSQPQSGSGDSQPLYGDPLFVNISEEDFHLKEGSPAIDAGMDVGIPYTGSGPDVGAFEYGMESATTEKDRIVLEKIDLLQNYPNPFNPVTEISYSLPYDADVELSIFDITGSRVKTLVKEIETGGFKTVKWDGKDENNMNVSSGTYFYQLKAGKFSIARRMLLIR